MYSEDSGKTVEDFTSLIKLRWEPVRRYDWDSAQNHSSAAVGSAEINLLLAEAEAVSPGPRSGHLQQAGSALLGTSIVCVDGHQDAMNYTDGMAQRQGEARDPEKPIPRQRQHAPKTSTLRHVFMGTRSED